MLPLFIPPFCKVERGLLGPNPVLDGRRPGYLRFNVFAFSGTLILNRSARGRDTLASKSLFLEH